MLKKAITLGIIMVLASSLMADFISDFQDAQKLLSQKKNVEAKEAFVKLSEAVPNTLIKSKCLAYAATALSNDKKYDEALALDGVHAGWVKNLKEKRGLSSNKKGND